MPSPERRPRHSARFLLALAASVGAGLALAAGALAEAGRGPGGTPARSTSAAPAPGASIPLPGGAGYWLAGADGAVFTFGDVGFFGSKGNAPPGRGVIGMAPTPTGGGYWLVTADGTVFPFGDARSFGSAGAATRPVVAMAATPTGAGYWLVAADGGVFTFGDARFFGSRAGAASRRAKPIVGLAASPTGGGYWLVDNAGEVFPFGDARPFGSMAGAPLARPVVGIATAQSGKGYWLAAADGGVFSFGDARFFGSRGGAPLARPAVGMISTPDGAGYWLVGADGGVFSFGDARFFGSRAGAPLLRSVVGGAMTGIPTNRIPHATADTAATDEDTPVRIPVLDNDRDLGDGGLSVTVKDGPPATAGVATVNGDSSITFTPAPNANGPVTFTYAVRDRDGDADTGTGTGTVTVTVRPVNDLPTVTPVVDQAIDEDTATATLPFTVGDVETAPGALTVTASSSDTAVVPQAGIALSGSGAGRTVTVTPAANRNGPTTITLTVADADGGATNTTFTVTVRPVNDPPTISAIADRTTDEDTPTAALPFTVGDVETAAGALTLSGTSSNATLVPDAAITFGGSGAARTVRVTPAPDQNGTATVTVTVADGDGGTRAESFLLTVAPVNDPPAVTAATVTVAENAANGTAVGTVAFTDPDVGQTHTFALTAAIPGGIGSGSAFAVDAATGALTVADGTELDFETTPTYHLTVAVTDNGSPVRTGSAAITVNLTDVNEAPALVGGPYPVPENSPAGTVVGTLTLTDPEAGQNHTVAISAGDSNGAFAVDNTGKITVADPTKVDHETTPSYSLTLTVTDDGTPPLSATLPATITVTDLNEAPVVPAAAASVAENAANGSDVTTVAFSDQDQGQTGTFSLTAGNTGGAFAIGSTTGKITVANGSQLNFEGPTKSYALTVKVTDDGSPVEFGTGVITVTVTDVNEAPVVNSATAAIPENSPATTAVTTATATDPDAGQTLTWSITAGNTGGAFAVDPATGAITAAGPLDHEGTPSYTLTLTATDNAPVTPLSGSAPITVTITDVNEAAAVTTTALSVLENSAVDSVVGTLAVDDPETAQHHNFAITGGNDAGAFSVVAATGVVKVADQSKLDHETTPTYSLTVAATDDGSPPETGTGTITVDVTDVNEAPVLSAATFTVAENAANGSPVGTPTMNDPDMAQGHTFSFGAGAPVGLPFAIDGATGAITVGDGSKLDYETDPLYAIPVKVVDAGVPALSDTATVTVNLTNVNDPPVNTVPGPVTAVPEADTKLPGLAVSDPDAGADPVKLTLAVGHGTLTVDSGVGGGITVPDLGANSAASVTITAPQAAINATLGSVGGVVYHPDSGFIGVDMLTVTTEDQGHNGSGPALTDVDTVGITVVDAAPAVKTTSPAGGATDVPLAGNVTVTFSEPVAVAGDWVHVNCSGSGLRTALSGLGVSGGPTTFTLDPTANFAFADGCTVSVLAAGVRDQDTNDPPDAPVADATFAFTTVDVAPTVTSTSPAEGATGVPATTGITVTFSEPVTTTLSAFSLICGATPVALATVPPAALGVPVPIPVTGVTFAPGGTLPPGTNCTIGIAAGAVHDSDTVDPPDTLTGATSFSFSVPPVAAADTYAATGNMAIAIPAIAPVPNPTSVPVGVLANDTGPSLVVDQVQGGPLTLTQDTAQAGLNAVHGHVTMASDGGFTYDPPPGFTGADSFTYRINGPGGPATATVTVNVSNLLWFVCHGCPGNNRGTLVDPFTSTGAFTAVNGSGTGAPAINQSIYLESASGNFTGATDTLVLKDGQKVYGQGRAASDILTPAPGTVPAFGTLTAGARPVIAPTTGNGITLASGNSLYDLNVGGVASTSSAIASKVGTAFGTLTVRNVTLQGTGQALTLNNGTADAIFDSVTSSSGATNISLTSVNGSLVLNGGTLSGATTRAVNIDGGSGTITYAGNIDATKGINVDHKTGGTVTFSGATKKLNTAVSPAVTLGNNPNTTITFSGGGLDIDTTSGNGFLANGMATALTVTGSGNTINSTTGTALSVTGATIGAGGLNFDTIAANGAVNGIVLSGTGSTGGLTAGGGTIQNTTGDGVLLIDTVQVALTNLTVKGAKGSGINGTGVTGFSLTGATVDGNGDDAGSDEAGIRFDNLWGTAAITSSTVTNSIEDNARVRNTAAPALSLTVTGSTFGQTPVGTPAVAPSNDGLLLEANQTANVTATVASSTFQNNWASGLQAITNDAGTLKLDVGSASAGTGGTFKDNNVSLNVAHDSTGTTALTMQSGAFSSPTLLTAASPINLYLGTGATAGAMTATVKGNTISNNHSPAGPGIRVNGNGTGTLTALIDSNTVTDVANRGIEVIARNGSNHVNATVTNNAVTLGDPLSTDAIRVDSGSVGTDTTTVCADVAGNQATTTGSPGPYYGIRLHRSFPGVNFLVKGMPTGASNPDAAVILYLAGRNTATVLADSAGAAGFSGTATCPTP